MWSDKYLLHYLKKTMLKLSSPLRTDQSKDDNKENILAGQDVQKTKTDDKSPDVPLIAEPEENTPNQSHCQEINGIDVNCNGISEGSSPATPLITSPVSSDTVLNSTSEENLNSVNHNSECLVNENNALNTTVTSEVNNFELDGPEQDFTLSNCEQKASTQSLYDDCVDIIVKTEEINNDPNPVEQVSGDLNSTYAVEESLQEIKKSPSEEISQNCTQIVSNTLDTTTILNNTEVIEDNDLTIIKHERTFVDSSETSNCGELLNSESTHENSDVVSEQSERFDYTLIESPPDAVLSVENRNEILLSDSHVLPAEPTEDSQLPVVSIEKTQGEPPHCEERDVSCTKSIENVSRNSSELDESLLNITQINRSVENLEKSTAKLVSDSSNGSLSASFNSTHLSESITNDCSVDGQSLKNNTDTNEANPLLINQSNSDCITEVVNTSSSAFIELTTSKSDLNRTFPEASSKESLPNIPEQPYEATSATTQLSNSFINKVAEVEVNTSSTVSEDIKHSCSEEKHVSTTLAIEKVDKPEVENIEVTSNIPKTKMEEINEKLQQEFSDTKLELNAVQQAKAALVLEMSKKDEIILKTQAEAMKKEKQYMQEIKVLKEQLKEKANTINEKDLKDSKDSLKDLEEALKEAKAKEEDYLKVLAEYETTIATRFSDYKKLKEESATVNRHLSNLELSFSDLHQKYEKAKSAIFSYKKNEEQLRNAFSVYEETFSKQEARYESLKAHAQTQIDKCNIEISQQKEKSDSEISKLKAIVKRLEIKIAGLETSLEQKTKECIDLAALCDEVTGKKF